MYTCVTNYVYMCHEVCMHESRSVWRILEDFDFDFDLDDNFESHLFGHGLYL